MTRLENRTSPVVEDFIWPHVTLNFISAEDLEGSLKTVTAEPISLTTLSGSSPGHDKTKAR